MNQQNAMENINLETLSLSGEQMEQLYNEFTRRFRLEEMSRRETRDREEVPPEILEELENSPKIDLSNNLKKFAKDIKRFEGGEWAAAETINKGFIPDLKKYTIDSLQAVSYKYKDADRLRVAAHAATEIFRELQFITNNEEERAERVSDEEIILTCIEKLRRLAIFSYATSKRIDQEARSIAAKALRLPDTIKHIADEEESDRKLAFAPEIVQQIQHAKYEDAIIRSATWRPRGSQQYRGNHFRGNNRGRGRSFFGRSKPHFAKDQEHRGQQTGQPSQPANQNIQ
jgi:hypothetical protein